MAQIPRKYIDNYTKSLNKLSADAQAKLASDLAKIDFTADVATIREAVITRMEFYCGPYANMAAILAANFYDGLREISVGKKLGALAESGREPIATEKAVRGIMQDVVDGKPEVAVGKLVSRVDYEIKKSAGECVYRNGKRDPLKPKYARVPQGAENCKFCIMLASRGFVYHNAKQAGENGHYHANCDCRIVPGFDDNPSVAGYDPSAYYDQYKKILEGHEKESHYDLLTRNGKTTKRMYKTAEYDYNAALGVKNKKDRVSAKFATHDGTHDFKKFEDVKQYIYGATSKADMEHRYSQLGKLYGFDSEQMQSQAMKNAFRHVEKRYADQMSLSVKSFSGIADQIDSADMKNMVETMKSIGDKRAIRFFETHGSKIRIENAGPGVAHFSPNENVVKLDLAVAIKGDAYHLPFQNIAHEGAHMIDFALGNGENLSLSYRNGAIAKALDADFDRFRKKKLLGAIDEDYLRSNDAMPSAQSILRTLRHDDADTLEDYKKLRRGELSESDVIDRYLGRYVENLVSYGDYNAELVRIIRSEMGEMPTEVTSCFSDMLEAYTGSLRPLGAGHGIAYWDYQGNKAMEFFAEYVDSLAFNPESAKIMRDAFPKATKIVEEMLDEFS